MDLSSLKVADTATMEVRHPVTEDTIPGMTITFHGPTSDVVRKMVLAKSQAALNRMTKGKKTNLDAKVLNDEAKVDAFKRATAWAGFEDEGKALEFNEATFVDTMEKYPWLWAQVNEFLGNDGSFLAS